MEKNMSNKYSIVATFKKFSLILSFNVGYVEQGKGSIVLYDDLNKKPIFDLIIDEQSGVNITNYWADLSNDKNELEAIHNVGKEHFIDVLKNCYFSIRYDWQKSYGIKG